ncbi:MAG: protein-ADP-ribose hydrolase [Oscillospiraceae bacterium]|nr:protein-ADP-ribose hydrolase [Oscillospiraceae bacterium]
MDKLNWLIDYLINEYDTVPDIPECDNEFDKFRCLINIRRPAPISDEFIKIQNEVLQEINSSREIADIEDMKPVKDNLYIWQGDITALKIDAIVNAANKEMTGCYRPMHKCIDNCIHTYSGVQLRLQCAAIMEDQMHPEYTGFAKITSAYNLPSRYVIHTVGPIVCEESGPTENDCNLLRNCYLSCLYTARQFDLRSIAFCCISTGLFHFPNRQAAQIAIETVSSFLTEHHSRMKVLFNVFTDEDLNIYKELLV